MTRFQDYARSAELTGRRIAHTIATTAGVYDAASLANNAGRAALRKCRTFRAVAAEEGIEVIPLDDVIAALESAIAGAELASDRAWACEILDLARERCAS